MQNLKVAILQYNTLWEDISGNLQALSDWLSDVPIDCDLLILPETFSTGFSMKPEQFAEEMNGTAVSWMREQAKRKGISIMGSLLIKENNHYYNRLVWVNADGSIQTYDKRHLFSYANEDDHYSAGNEIIQCEIKNWKVRPLICYDLRFPVWSKNNSNYDLLLYTANWPEKRIAHWRNLLVARAIENQAFVIGANRYGTDGNDIEYRGHSMIISPNGTVLNELVGEENLLVGELEYNHISKFRQYLSVLEDSDDFTITGVSKPD